MNPARFFRAAIICSLAALIGCGGGSVGGGGNNGGGNNGGGQPNPVVTSVTVTCKSSTIEVNQTDQCASSSAVTWTIDPASVGSVDSNGLVTGLAAGTATVTATSVQTPS